MSGVALIHVKLLGDYVLWFPYGQAMVRHCKECNRQPVLVVNKAYGALVHKHFPSCQIFEIDCGRVVRDLRYRSMVLLQLRALPVGDACQTSYFRDAIIDDAIVRAIGVPALGFDVAYADRTTIDRFFSRSRFRRLLKAMPGAHQFARNQALAQAIGINNECWHFSPDFWTSQHSPSPYFVLAPGGSRGEKMWPVEYFLEVAARLLERCPGWHCVIVGSVSERSLGNFLSARLENRVENRVGETNVLEYVEMVAGANLAISNDSATAHIAAACGVPAVVVLGGGHFGGFFPYDIAYSHIERPPRSVYITMPCFGCDWICRYPVRKGLSFPCIAGVTPGLVWKEIERCLSLATGKAPASAQGKEGSKPAVTTGTDECS